MSDIAAAVKGYNAGVEAVAADLERRALLWEQTSEKPTESAATLLRAVAASARLLKQKEVAR